MKELDKQMNPYNNETSTKANSTESKSSDAEKKKGDRKSDLSLVEIEKVDDPKQSDKKEFGDDHIKDKKNVTNSTTSEHVPFDDVF